MNGTRGGRRLVIVGAGVSGIAAFIATVRLRTAASIVIADPLGIGRGVAFAVRNPALLCNTSVETMSIVDDDPNDFLAYLQAIGVSAMRSAFVPRAYVADYLIARYTEFAAHARNAGIDHRKLDARVLSVAKTSVGYQVSLSDSTVLEASDVLICTGNGAPQLPDIVRSHVGAEHFFESLYPEDRVLASLAPRSRVLVLGSRLSAVDAAILLGRAGHTIAIASPSGRLPAVRTDTPLVSAVPADMDAFARLDVNSPRLAWRLMRIVARSASAVQNRPLHEQVERNPNAIERLRNEIMLARQGVTDWQQILVEHMDAAAIRLRNEPLAQQRQSIAECSRVVGRYLFACPLENAAQLLDLADGNRLTVAARTPAQLTRHDRWRVRWSDGTSDAYDAIVCATGFETPSLLAGTAMLALHRDVPDGFKAPDVSADLRVWFIGAPHPERIWTLGIASQFGSPITNAVYQAVRQAGEVCRFWQAEDNATHQPRTPETEAR